jgi:hypothetical protein
MDEETRSELLALGERLLEVCPEKFRQVLRGLRDVVEAQEVIRRFDWQLMFRGRPRKRYLA